MMTQGDFSKAKMALVLTCTDFFLSWKRYPLLFFILLLVIRERRCHFCFTSLKRVVKFKFFLRNILSET